VAAPARGVPSGPRVIVVSELYYPEETSTGYLLTRIAEGLATCIDVTVACAQPTYAARGTRAPRSELRNGVRIRRCSGTTLDKDFLPYRLLNLASISLTLLVYLLRELRRGDLVLVVTNPPSLPFVAALACLFRKARVLLLVHDVYPEALFAAGLLAPRARMARLLDRLNAWLYGRAERIVTLGRDMSRLVAGKAPGVQARIVEIPNWADTDQITPEAPDANPLLRELGIDSDALVVQYAGNMGRSHAIEDALLAADRLRDRGFHFLFIGSGAKRGLVERAIRLAATNVTLLASRPRSDQQVFLNGCHVALIPFVAGMAGVSVPSRMYNVLAAGKPLVAMADADSEIATLIREENVGWVVRPGDVDGLVRVLQEAERSVRGPEGSRIGARARAAAVERYPLERALSAYRALVEELLGRVGAAAARSASETSVTGA
jgi:glycosyltransferase involved in cell wall biosynthesis